MTPSALAAMVAVAVSSTASGCLHGSSPPLPTDPALDETWLSEPSRQWASAVTFQFADSTVFPNAHYSTRIEFHDGARRRTITADNYLRLASGRPRTPWYRLRPGRDTTFLPVRVTLDHEGGGRTVAVFPLPIFRDEFFDLFAGVARREPTRSGSPPPPVSLRGYPLDAAARAEPGDSLWIYYFATSRRCFNCPR